MARETRRKGNSNSGNPTTSNSSARGRASRKPRSSVSSSSNGVDPQRNGSRHAGSSPANSSTRKNTEEFYKALFGGLVEVGDPSTPSSSSVDDQQASSSTDQLRSGQGHVVLYKKKIVDQEQLTNFIKRNADSYESIVHGRRNHENEANGRGKVPDSEVLPTTSEVGRHPKPAPPKQSTLDRILKALKKATPGETSAALPTSSEVEKKPNEKKEPAYYASFKKASILRQPSRYILRVPVQKENAPVLKIKLLKRSSQLFKHLSTFGSHAPKRPTRSVPIPEDWTGPKRRQKVRRLFEEFPMTERCKGTPREDRSTSVPFWLVDEEYMNPILPSRSQPFTNPVGLVPNRPTPSPPLPPAPRRAEISDEMEELVSILQKIPLGAVNRQPREPSLRNSDISRETFVVFLYETAIGPQIGDTAEKQQEMSTADDEPSTSGPPPAWQLAHQNRPSHSAVNPIVNSSSSSRKRAKKAVEDEHQGSNKQRRTQAPKHAQNGGMPSTSEAPSASNGSASRRRPSAASSSTEPAILFLDESQVQCLVTDSKETIDKFLNEKEDCLALLVGSSLGFYNFTLLLNENCAMLGDDGVLQNSCPMSLWLKDKGELMEGRRLATLLKGLGRAPKAIMQVEDLREYVKGTHTLLHVEDMSCAKIADSFLIGSADRISVAGMNQSMIASFLKSIRALPFCPGVNVPDN